MILVSINHLSVLPLIALMATARVEIKDRDWKAELWVLAQAHDLEAREGCDPVSQLFVHLLYLGPGSLLL